MIAVVLLDDHAGLREGIASRLEAEADLTVTGQASSAEEALALISEGGRPDVLITDCSLPGMSGLELTRVVQDQWPDLPVLMISTHPETIYAPKALEAGACGYLSKSMLATELIPALRQVARGEPYLSEAMQTRGLAATASC